MHERSETYSIEDGRGLNTYGRGTGKWQQPLPKVHRFESDDATYPTVGIAEEMAGLRSQLEGFENPHSHPITPYSLPPANKGSQVMPGLSQYQFAGMSPDPRMAQDPRSPMLANHTMSGADNDNMDNMLRNLDSGAQAPSNLSQARQTMGPGSGQQANPWLQWLQKYLQQKQGGQQQPQPQMPQRQ